jgi:hypothetical protein
MPSIQKPQLNHVSFQQSDRFQGQSQEHRKAARQSEKSVADVGMQARYTLSAARKVLKNPTIRLLVAE